MSKAVKNAHQYMVSGAWTASNCETYLKVNGLNMKAIKSVIDNASNEIIYKTAKEKKKSDKSTYKLISTVKKTILKIFNVGIYLHYGVDQLIYISTLML